MSKKRWWQNWDEPGVAEWLDKRLRAREMGHHLVLGTAVLNLVRLGERFLEVGCGSGLMYFRLPGLDYTGVDTSREMLAIAKRNYPSGNFKRGDIYNLRYKDDRFDVVGAFGVLGHLPDIEPPIREMIRVASRLVLFTVWPAKRTVVGKVTACGHEFIRNEYARGDILAAVGDHEVDVQRIGPTLLYMVTV